MTAFELNEKMLKFKESLGFPDRSFPGTTRIRAQKCMRWRPLLDEKVLP